MLNDLGIGQSVARSEEGANGAMDDVHVNHYPRS